MWDVGYDTIYWPLFSVYLDVRIRCPDSTSANKTPNVRYMTYTFRVRVFVFPSVSCQFGAS